MTGRDGAAGAMLCWMLLVLVSFGAQRIGDPARRGRQEAEGWAVLQARFIEEGNAREDVARRELQEIYAGGLDGFLPLSTRVRPLPDLSPQRHGALIDLGAQDGVAVGHGIIGRTGVVGIVAEVTDQRARIVFCDDPEFRTSFWIEGKGRGIVAGGPGRGEMHPMTRLDPIQFAVDDLLVTSGEDPRFPPSLIIGLVRSARLPMESTRIEPPPGFSDPQEVLVLTLPQFGGRP